MLFYIIAIIFLLALLKIVRGPKTKPGYKNIPIVSGGLPIIGHGFAFSADVVGFVKKCYQRYGKVFKFKIFNKNIVVICDHNLKKEFFKDTEENMSLYQLLTNLYFADAFSDDPKNLPIIIKLVKSTVAVKFDTFVPKILDEAQKMINRLKNHVSQKISISSEMIRFVANTSARCFIGITMNDQFYDVLIKFTNLLNRIVVLTYFLPKWLLRITIGLKLAAYRKQMTKMLHAEIETYRHDLEKVDSLILRRSVDYVDDVSGYKLKNDDIGDIIVCLLYVSSENTALGLLNTMVDLAQNEEYWNKVKLDSAKYLGQNDIKGLFSSQIIDSCLMESARMGTHIFPIGRKPLKKDTIGEYFLDNDSIDNVSLCLPLMMSDNDVASDVFVDSETYDPSRYQNNSNAKNSTNIMTWGSGSHLCPGKQFAIYEIKMAMALLTTTFKQFAIPKKIAKDYFSPSAFAEKKAEFCLELSDSQTSLDHLKISQDKVIIEYDGGWLIKDYLSNSEQIECYTHIVDSINPKLPIDDVAESKIMSVARYNMVYTQSSNCAKPLKLINIASEVFLYLHQNSKTFPMATDYNFDSVHMQVFGSKSSMRDHYDEHVTWGVSLSIGASCDMKFGGQTIRLDSGDIFVADFSKVLHSIQKIYDNRPTWYQNGYEYDNDKYINTFGSARASIQIRNFSECKIDKILTETEFKQMFN